MTLGLSFSDYSFRPLDLEDVNRTLEWRNHSHVREGMFHSRCIDLEDHKAWVTKQTHQTDSYYYIFSYKDQPRGMFGVYDIKPPQNIGEWVYFMAPRDATVPKGSGAAMEFLAIDTFFTKAGIRRLWGRTLQSNERVWKMHQRFGFVVEGTLREHVDKDGELIDVLCVGLLRSEWAERRERVFREIFSSVCRLPLWPDMD